MRSKITVVDAPTVAEQLTQGDWVEVVTDLADLPGSDLVVIGRDADVADVSGRVASRASGAAIVVLDETEVRTALDASLLTRGRVFSVGEDAVRDAAEAVLFDRRSTVTVTLVGLDNEVATRSVILGAGGVRQIVG
jgi:hypothetical protein